MIDRLIVATCWNGPFVLAPLHEGEPRPTAEELAAMSARLTDDDGNSPVVRVVERAAR
jgi:hypothetical protein